MALQLQKVSAGERINLSKDHSELKKIKIGLSWDVKEGVTADLDASLVVLGENEKLKTSLKKLTEGCCKNQFFVARRSRATKIKP